MKKKIIRMDSQNVEAMHNADKAIVILGDLFQSYSFAGEAPTMEEASKLSIEAMGILTYISIALDYVSDIKSVLKKNAEDLDALFDEAKRMEGDRANG